MVAAKVISALKKQVLEYSGEDSWKKLAEANLTVGNHNIDTDQIEDTFKIPWKGTKYELLIDNTPIIVFPVCKTNDSCETDIVATYGLTLIKKIEEDFTASHIFSKINQSKKSYILVSQAEDGFSLYEF